MKTQSSVQLDKGMDTLGLSPFGMYNILEGRVVISVILVSIIKNLILRLPKNRIEAAKNVENLQS